jgi:hypothetical protein
VRFLLSLLCLLLAVVCALGSGAGAMLARNVLDPAGFSRAVVATVQSPAGLGLARASVQSAVSNRAAAQPALIAEGAAGVAGAWTVRALRSDAAAQILAPVAVALQQGILTGTQQGSVELDVRALAAAAETPPVVTGILDVVPGPLLVEVPWLSVAPLAQTVLQELDRHPWLPMGLAIASLGFGMLAVITARRRGLSLVLLGATLATSAFLLQPLATDATRYVVRGQGQDVSTGPLAAVFVDQLFDGWRAVSGALIAIGLALVLVGLVFGIRRTQR